MGLLVTQGFGSGFRLLVTQGFGFPPQPAPPSPPPPPAALPSASGGANGPLGVLQLSQLNSVFKTAPRTGRQKSTLPAADIQTSGPYVVLDCKLDRRDLIGADSKGLSAWNDYRTVTMTVYGTRADVVRGLAVILGIFNRSLGVPGQPTLTYPSGARFIRWMPRGNAVIEEDPDSKAGKDVWRGIVMAEVWSIRSV